MKINLFGNSDFFSVRIADDTDDAELRGSLLLTRLLRKEMSETQKHFPRLLCPKKNIKQDVYG